MADSDLYSIYFTPQGGTISGTNVFLLPPGDDSTSGGGRTDGISQITVSGGELAIAGNYAQGNISFSGTDKEDKPSTLYVAAFTSGGSLNLSAQTGDIQRQNGHNETSQYSDDRLVINTEFSHNISQNASTERVPTSGTYEFGTFQSSGGTFRVVSDLVGTISTHHTTSLTGLRDKDGKPVNNSSDNTITTATLRANSVELYNNFIGDITAKQTAIIRCFQSAAANNNTITLQGLWADTGSIVADGRFGIQKNGATKGSITVETESIEIRAETSLVSFDSSEIRYYRRITEEEYNALSPNQKKDYELVNGSYYPRTSVEPDNKRVYTQEQFNDLAGAEDLLNSGELLQRTVYASDSMAGSATGNQIGVYGIRAANAIEMKKGFEAEVNTTLQNITVSAHAKGDNQKASLSIDLKAYSLTAQNFSVTGSFLGDINTAIRGLSFSAQQPADGTGTAVVLSAGGLYFSDSITVSNYLSGNISVVWDSSSSLTPAIDSWTGNFYGIYAGNTITVGSGTGVFDSNITMNLSGAEAGERAYATVIGIKAETLNAGSLAANINLTVETGLAIGAQIDKFVNNVDSVFNVQTSSFDIIGDITVTGTSAIKVGLMIRDSGATNIRISSDINVGRAAGDYAIYSGYYSYRPSKSSANGRGYTLTTWRGGNDHIEIAAGATITGNINLGSGTDEIYIDSNAQINGELISDATDQGGRRNVTFMLNQYGSVNGDIRNEKVYNGSFIEESTTYVVDLNDAASGVTYTLFDSGMVAGGSKNLTVVYKGEAKLLNMNSSPVVTFTDGTSITGRVQGNTVSVEVTKSATAYQGRLANTVNLEINGNVISYTFSNDIDRDKLNYDSNYSLHITYNLYDGNGNIVTDETGKARTYELTVPCTSSSFTVPADYTIKNIQTEIINTASGSPERIDTLTVTGRIDSEAEEFIVEWNTALNKALTDANRYELEYSIKKKDGSWSNSTVVTLDYLATSYTLSDIQQGDAVRVRLRLKNVASTSSYTTSEWSDVIEIENGTLKEETAQVAGLMNLRVGQLADSVSILQWDDMRDTFESGLQYYEIQFFTTNDESISNLTDEELEAIWSGNNTNFTVVTRRVTTNKFYLSNVDFSNNYYWRVKAVSNNGTGGEPADEIWSENYHFTTVGGDITAPVATPNSQNIAITPHFYYVKTDGVEETNPNTGEQTLNNYAKNTITLNWYGKLADDTGSGIAFYVLYYKEEGDSSYKSIRLAPNSDQYYKAVISGLSGLNQKISYYITARDYSGNESAALKSGDLQGDITKPAGASIAWEEPENKNDLYVENPSGGRNFAVTLTVNCGYDPESSEIDAPSGIYSYTVQYQKISSGGQKQWITVDVRYAAQLEGLSSYTVTAPPIDTRDIPVVGDNNECPTYWRLLVEDNAGNVFESPTLTITAEEPGTILLSTGEMDVSATVENYGYTVNFTWAEASSSPYQLSGYKLYVRQQNTTEWIEVTPEYTSTNITVKAFLNDTMTKVLLGDTVYEWAVEAFDEKGFSSGKQKADKTFTLDGYVPPPESFTFKNEQLVSVYENDMLNITISWSIGSGIPTGYELKRAVAGSGVYETFMTADASATKFNFTVSPNAKYDYVIVARDTNYPDVPVTSKVLSTMTDVTKPVFTSSNTTLTDLTGNNYQLTWSGAVDPNGAAGEPVSGLKEYNLYFSTSSTLDPGKAICITVGGATNYTLTRDILLANGISEGTYYWWVGAKDWAGNEGYLQGQGSFFVKLTPPKGEFTDMDTTITVSYEMVDDPTVSNGAQVRQPTSISVKFDMDSTFTDAVKYRIELASSADFASDYLLLSEEFTGSSFTLSTDNNGIAYIAGMAQGKNGYYSTYNDVPDIYWRVCAIDSYGNETVYSKTNVFKLADKDLDRSLNDYYAPDQVELYAPEEVEGSNGTLWNLEWSPVFDPFGIYTYEIALSNGVDAPLLFYTQPHINDTTVVIGGKELPVSAGTYTVTVTAIDGSGKRSPVSNSQTVHCGVPNPIYPGSGTSIMDPEGHSNASATPDKSYSATITSTIGTEGNVEHYYRYDGVEKNGRLNLSITGLSQKVKITLYADNQSGKWKKLKSFTVNAGGGTLLSDYLLASNLYYIKVEAMDKKKFNTQTSYVLNFDSTYFPDWTPNKGFGDQSEEIILTTTDSQKTGSISGFVGYLEAQDYYVINSDIAGSLNLSVSTNAKIKVTVYNADYRKITSASVKAGQYSNIFKKPALCPSGKVYIVVESGDKGKGKQNADYTIGVSDNLFQPATANNDTGSAQSVLLDVNGHGLFSGGWVGYGDKVDYYKFTSALNGAVELGITEVESKIKVTLYDTTGKKLKSKTIKGTPDAKYATADIFGKDVLLKAGQEYYISVESGDKGKGYQNSFYNLSINENYAPASRGNNVKENAMALTAGQTTSDWVGYNEPSDFYKITLDKESYLDLNFNFSGKVSLKMTSEYGGKSGNVSLIKTDSGYSSKSMLAAGEYFVEIRAKSPNNVNSWSNSYNLAYSTR